MGGDATRVLLTGKCSTHWGIVVWSRLRSYGVGFGGASLVDWSPLYGGVGSTQTLHEYRSILIWIDIRATPATGVDRWPLNLSHASGTSTFALCMGVV